MASDELCRFNSGNKRTDCFRRVNVCCQLADELEPFEGLVSFLLFIPGFKNKAIRGVKLACESELDDNLLKEDEKVARSSRNFKCPPKYRLVSVDKIEGKCSVANRRNAKISGNCHPEFDYKCAKFEGEDRWIK